MVMMQGVLWKWTNYLSGWQPRWFVLDYGVLAYYRSQEEVHLGSRGSVKMSCCEIYVHPTDPVRLDLKIPPENHMYLRAATAGERQQWLVALGTAKACLVDGNYQEHQQQINSVNFLKDKMSELNMCRNIMMQQVHQIKTLCTNKDNTKELNEASTMLSATCDTFLSDLSDVMEIIEDNLSTVSGSPVSTPLRINRPQVFRKQSSKERGGTPPSSPSSSIFSDSLTGSDKGNARSPTQYHSVNGNTLAPVQENTAASPNVGNVTKTTGESTKIIPTSEVKEECAQRPAELALNKMVSERQPVAVAPSPNVTATVSDRMDGNLYALSQQSLESHSSDEHKNEPKSFFASVPTRFEDVHVLDDGSIPTKPFLDACSAVLPFFDVLGSTTFAPVKMDIQGNIKKLATKFETDEEAFSHLQNIIFQEMKSNTCNARNSCTEGLLWLKRALDFIHIFLAEVAKGEQDLAVAANAAYSRSLKKYHGWVVRGVFALAVKAVPYRKDFLLALGTSEKGVVPANDVIKDMNCSVTALGKIVSILSQFYKKHKLDSDATV